MNKLLLEYMEYLLLRESRSDLNFFVWRQNLSYAQLGTHDKITTAYMRWQRGSRYVGSRMFRYWGMLQLEVSVGVLVVTWKPLDSLEQWSPAFYSVNIPTQPMALEGVCEDLTVDQRVEIAKNWPALRAFWDGMVALTGLEEAQRRLVVE